MNFQGETSADESPILYCKGIGYATALMWLIGDDLWTYELFSLPRS